MKIPSIELGKAGAHLVCSDLILQGYRAFLVDEQAPYDVCVDIGNKILRIQVKSTQKPQKNKKYLFGLTRRNHKQYQKSAFDLFALVALDIKKIGYLKLSDIKFRRGVSISDEDNSRTNTFEQVSFEKALSENNNYLRHIHPVYDQNGVFYESIAGAAKILGLSNSNISQILNGKRKHTKGYTFSHAVPREEKLVKL